jgi:hypothetical protein
MLLAMVLHALLSSSPVKAQKLVLHEVLILKKDCIVSTHRRHRADGKRARLRWVLIVVPRKLYASQAFISFSQGMSAYEIASKERRNG